MRLKGALSLPGEEIERQFYGCLFHLVSGCFHDLPFAVERDFAPNRPLKKEERCFYSTQYPFTTVEKGLVSNRKEFICKGSDD
jgi:hypothetical protein